MFKNITLYRLAPMPQLDAAALAYMLRPQAFAPIGNLEIQSQGFVPPRDGADLVVAVGRQLFLKHRTEKKLLPAAVINEATDARCAELEEQQGFKPGRKQRKEVREAVTDELLPRAFSTSSYTRVWIDPVNGWFVIDSATPSKCDAILRAFLKSFDKFPITGLRVNRSPVASMTDWVASDEAPYNFTVDNETELRGTGEGKATVRYIRHSLDADDLGRHINAGKQCTRLALTWADRISFVLTEDLTLKRVEPLNILKETGEPVGNEIERFESDMTLMSGEYAKLFADLVDVLGGEYVDATVN